MLTIDHIGNMGKFYFQLNRLVYILIAVFPLLFTFVAGYAHSALMLATFGWFLLATLFRITSTGSLLFNKSSIIHWLAQRSVIDPDFTFADWTVAVAIWTLLMATLYLVGAGLLTLVPILIVAVFDTSLMSKASRFKNFKPLILVTTTALKISARHRGSTLMDKLMERIIKHAVDHPAPFAKAYESNDISVFADEFDVQLNSIIDEDERSAMMLLLKIDALNQVLKSSKK